MILKPTIHAPDKLASLFSRFESKDPDVEGLTYLEMLGLIASMVASGSIEYAAGGYQAILGYLFDANKIDEEGNIYINDEEFADLLFDPNFRNLKSGPTF